MNKRICFVVQRYGLEVNGGAELLCRQIAELMISKYDIEVLTTKAIDYMTWQDEYIDALENINGVVVRRFSVEKRRDKEEFLKIYARFLQGSMVRSEEQILLEEQGPYVPSLIDYIKEHKDNYNVFVFFTYMYYPTVMGIQEVKNKAIVFPFAHDEPIFRMKIFSHVFLKPKAFVFETEEERRLIRGKYNNYDIPFKLGGAGVIVPSRVSGEEFRKKYNLNSYIIYVGRIETGKNCNELFEFFIKYKKCHPGDLKLVLLGKSAMEIPKGKEIIELGFVSEEDKFNGIAGSEFLVLPSKFESLSIVVLEAFSLGIPVLVNGLCEVLKGHCIRSNGGFCYKSFWGFEAKMFRLLNDSELRKKMGENGRTYVEENYQWEIIKEKISSLIEYVSESQ